MIFRILAAVLHLGNVEILQADVEGDEESCNILSNDRHLIIVTELLGIDFEQIRTWLCNRKIVSMREVFTKPMTVTQVNNCIINHLPYFCSSRFIKLFRLYLQGMLWLSTFMQSCLVGL